jgi:hypothetical protein
VSAWLPRRRAARVFAAALVLLGLLALLGAQGARLGPWRVPPLAPAWTVLAMLAAIALPAADRPARARALVPALLLLAVSAWPLWTWRQAAARPRVPVLARLAVRGQDDPRPAGILLPDLARLRRGPPWQRLLGRRHDFVLDVDLWVWAPGAGAYRLEVDADDAASLDLDGRRVLEETDHGAAEVALERGPHALRLHHVQGEGAAHVALDWDRPPWLELLPLEAYASSRPEELTAPLVGRRHARALASLAAALAWWTVAALVAARAGESRRAWPAVERGHDRIAAAGRGFWASADRRMALATAAAAGLLLFTLQAANRPRAVDGLYFQAFTSEYLMQTVSAADLRDEPWRSLLYLHIQPPALDGLRALLARLPSGPTDQALVRGVDAGLYVAWGVVYMALIALAARWLARLTPRAYAAAAAALLALHPATLFYATLLDTTLLSAFLLAWLVYELWRASIGEGSPGRLAAAAIALFLTRSAFQWPFLLVLLASLRLVGVPGRRALRTVAPVALVMALYVGKQYALYGVTMTSTFAADSFCKGLAEYCLGTTPVPLPALPDAAAARVLSRTQKTNGEYNYNQLAFLRRSFSQMAEYRQLLRGKTPGEVLGAWAHNLAIYLRPSSRYSAHVIVDRLPWRNAGDRLFSGWPLVGLVAVSAAAALTGPGRVPLRRAAGLALPVAYVFAVTVVFEGGENMRYKFFVEPLVYVFAAAQAYRLAVRVRDLRGTPPSPSRPGT